jgi:hypothetical protein
LAAERGALGDRLPWGRTKKRYFVATEPRHPTGEPFRQPRPVAGIYVDTHMGRAEALRTVRAFLEAVGLPPS